MSRRSIPDVGDINEQIVRIYADQSQIYLDDEFGRQRHWAAHPTHFACLKCMDGRVHVPEMTSTPTGLVKPFRAIGGKFEIFWPAFIARLDEWVLKASRRSARCLVFVTYHYSASDPNLGCAGWKYDTAAARKHAEKLCHGLHKIYQDQLLAVSTGVETDTDMFVLHGPNGDVRGDQLIGMDEDDARKTIRRGLPEIDQQSLDDLLPFLMGNAQRIASLRQTPRAMVDLGHLERVIAVGQEFSSLAVQNFALMINDVDPNLDEAIVTAASIIHKNIEGMPQGDDATIFTNVTFEHPGKSKRVAEERSRGLQEFAQWAIRDRNPQLWKSGRLRYLTGITSEQSKALEVVEQGRCG